jgi:uncharacterized protein DUF4340
MKLSGLLIAAIVLAALSGALYWSNHHPPADAPAKISSDTPPKILDLKEADISRVEIKKKTSEELALERNSSGKWQITAPKPLGADQDAVSSMISTLSSLNSERLVDEKAADLKQYGLAQPTVEVDITTKDKPRKLLIGDDTPAGNAVFAKLEGDPRVFTLASYNKTSIDKGANDFRDKRLLTADFDKLSRVEVVTKKQSLEFARNKQEWQILKPKPLRADNYQVEEFVRKLRDAKMDLSGTDSDEKKAATGFAAGAPVGRVSVTDSSGTQELQVHKNKDDYYAKSTAVAGIYKVPSDLGQAFDKKLDDFRIKKLFDFGFDEPNKVELHDSAKAYFLTKGGEHWWSDGKKMDATTVQSLIDKLRGLSASKFVENGFTTPVLEASVTSNDNKRVEKVLICKNGDRYIAKRENEPSLYEVEGSAVTELQKSAADLKQAPPPAAPTKKK